MNIERSFPVLPQKFYVQYMPDEASISLLQDIQSAIHVDDGRLVHVDQLHLTVLHFGFIEETYIQLADVVQGLSKETYIAATQNFIRDVRTQLPDSCELTICGFDYFGAQGTVLVTLLQADRALQQAHEHTMEQLQIFAEQIGIKDISDIPSRPRALQIPDTLTPHISLAKSMHWSLDLQSLTEKYVGKTLRLTLYEPN